MAFSAQSRVDVSCGIALLILRQRGTDTGAAQREWLNWLREALRLPPITHSD